MHTNNTRNGPADASIGRPPLGANGAVRFPRIEGARGEFLIDRDTTVIGVDAGGQRMVNSPDYAIRIEKERLRLGSEADSALTMWLRSPERSQRQVCLPSACASLRMSATMLEPASSTSRRDYILVRVGAMTGAFNFVRLGRQLGLSPAESSLFEALCTGKNVAEHCDARHIKIVTGRTQLKSIQRKLCLHSQVDIVRLGLSHAYGVLH